MIQKEKEMRALLEQRRKNFKFLFQKRKYYEHALTKTDEAIAKQFIKDLNQVKKTSDDLLRQLKKTPRNDHELKTMLTEHFAAVETMKQSNKKINQNKKLIALLTVIDQEYESQSNYKKKYGANGFEYHFNVWFEQDIYPDYAKSLNKEFNTNFFDELSLPIGLQQSIDKNRESMANINSFKELIDTEERFSEKMANAVIQLRHIQENYTEHYVIKKHNQRIVAALEKCEACLMSSGALIETLKKIDNSLQQDKDISKTLQEEYNSDFIKHFSNLTQTNEMYESIIKNNQNDFLLDLSTLMDNNSHDLSSFLIEPTQRMIRYSDLLNMINKELVKKEKNQSTKNFFHTALELANDQIVAVDNSKQQKQSQAKPVQKQKNSKKQQRQQKRRKDAKKYANDFIVRAEKLQKDIILTEQQQQTVLSFRKNGTANKKQKQELNDIRKKINRYNEGVKQLAEEINSLAIKSQETVVIRKHKNLQAKFKACMIMIKELDQDSELKKMFKEIKVPAEYGGSMLGAVKYKDTVDDPELRKSLRFLNSDIRQLKKAINNSLPKSGVSQSLKSLQKKVLKSFDKILKKVPKLKNPVRRKNK